MILQTAALFTLITVSHDGTVKTQEGLSEHACREAASVATTGYALLVYETMRLLAIHDAEEQYKQWAMKHPKSAKQCEAREAATFAGTPYYQACSRYSVPYIILDNPLLSYSAICVSADGKTLK